MAKRVYTKYVADFETTVYNGQKRTDVWAAAIVPIGTENVSIYGSIEEFWDHINSLPGNLMIYFHNLKFDGAFLLDYILGTLKYSTAWNAGAGDFYKEEDMPTKSVRYSITDMGAWYTITVRNKKRFIEFRDSLKLLPFSVKAIGKGFGTKHKKLDMEYEGFRYPGCPITDKEKRYIANDVLVVKEALEIMFERGHDRLTIGSCCMAEYRSMKHRAYDTFFPNVYDMEIDGHDAQTAGDWIHNSYRGGWCYLVKGKENRIFRNGVTADVNSLYPSMMHSESGNLYPVGKPVFWSGNLIPKEAEAKNRFFFIRFKCRFNIKKGKLPFIQIKGSRYYRPTEMLETSDFIDRHGERHAFVIDENGNRVPLVVTLTMTQTDYRLFLEHYDTENFEILDGCYFNAISGIFDDYINTYRKQKIEAKTKAERQIAKLFLNNLYGKMAASPNSSFKIVSLGDDKRLHFSPVEQYDKKPGYIPVGSAITSYARCFTIRAAQANYHGVDKPGFIYADTDSIHCDLPAEEVKGITVHPKNFCCWKLESSWDTAIFARQKTYIEHITAEDLEAVENPYFCVKCAGMPERSKHLFVLSMTEHTEEDEKEIAEMPEEFQAFVKEKRSMKDFKTGLKVPGKLLPKIIPGGVLLTEGYYEMRPTAGCI